jgi:hypothetical protein
VIGARFPLLPRAELAWLLIALLPTDRATAARRRALAFELLRLPRLIAERGT